MVILARFCDYAGLYAVRPFSPDCMGPQAVLPAGMVLLVGLQVQGGTQARLHDWMGLRLCSERAAVWSAIGCALLLTWLLVGFSCHMEPPSVPHGWVGSETVLCGWMELLSVVLGWVGLQSIFCGFPGYCLDSAWMRPQSVFHSQAGLVLGSMAEWGCRLDSAAGPYCRLGSEVAQCHYAGSLVVQAKRLGSTVGQGC